MAYLYPPRKNITDLVARIDKMPSFSDTVFQNSFIGYKVKLHQIKEFNDVTRYRVVFIGAPGKGKTTAICNWLGLLKPEKKGENPNNLSLLQTGTGRTTIAEVHIDQVDGESSFDLEYVSRRQQEEYIRDYCEYYYNEMKGALLSDGDESDITDDSSSSQSEQTYIEIERAIRNMAALQVPSSEDRKKHTPAYESVMRLINSYTDSEAFVQAMLNRINLDKRQMTHLQYDGYRDFTTWLKGEFRKINNGQNPNTSIAERIYIHIGKKNMDLHLPDYVKEIIDTKGLDTSARPDLLQLTRAKDTICFMIDESSKLPSQDVRCIMRDSFTCSDDMYLVKKNAIFVRCTEYDLGNVNEADGDPDRGMEIKTRELARRVNADRLRYDCENTLFLNTMQAYVLSCETRFVIGKDGKKTRKVETKVSDYDLDCAQYVSETINKHVLKMIINLKSTLEKDALTIASNIQELVNKAEHSKDQQTRNELNSVKKNINALKDEFASRFPEHYSSELVDAAIACVAWQTVRKMNRCYGGYQTWHTNIFDEMKRRGCWLFSDEANEIVQAITGCFESVKDETAANLVTGFKHKLEAERKRQEELVEDEIFRWTYGELFYPESSELSFWNTVNAIKGSGYRNRVIEEYQHYLRLKKADERIWQILTSRAMALYNTALDLIHI